jgi:hypothetical protein
MNASKNASKIGLLTGLSIAGIIGSSSLQAASALTISGVLVPGFFQTVNGITFSEFSTTSSDANWLAYTVGINTVNPVVTQINFTNVGGSSVSPDSYDIRYRVTSSLPILSIGANVNAHLTTLTKNIALTSGGSNISGFPVVATDTTGLVTQSVNPTLTSFYVNDVNVIAPGGDLTSSSNRFVAVPWETDALPVVGATIAFGAGIFAKRKFASLKSKNVKLDS